jgi:TPR repeat protein
MSVLKLSLVAGSMLALAGAAAASPGEIGGARTMSGPNTSMMMSFQYSGGARVAPGQAVYERAAAIHRFEGAGRALPLYRAAAAAGSPQALRELGYLYVSGNAVARDRQRGLEYLYEAARRDDAPAMFALASAFGHGEGVERDDALARFWLVRAAETGYRPAMEARRRLAAR